MRKFFSLAGMMFVAAFLFVQPSKADNLNTYQLTRDGWNVTFTLPESVPATSALIETAAPAPLAYASPKSIAIAPSEIAKPINTRGRFARGAAKPSRINPAKPIDRDQINSAPSSVTITVRSKMRGKGKWKRSFQVISEWKVLFHERSW